MAKAFILVRKSDNQVVGVNKEAISPDPADPVVEFNEDVPARSPHQLEIFRTGANAYNITGTLIKKPFETTFDSDIDSAIDGAADLAALKTVLKGLLKRTGVR